MHKITAFFRLFVKRFARGDSARASDAQELAGLPMPEHVAIIMDGNNRWAKAQNLGGVSGHKTGVETIRKVLSVCQEMDIKVLTLFAFSSENWLRPQHEVLELMKLLKAYLQNEVDELHSRGTRLRFIGRRDRLDAEIVDLMASAEGKTAHNTGANLVLAIDYGGRWDIAEAARQIAQAVSAGVLQVDAIDEVLVDQYTAMADLPTPDLCIRTGAEHRLSNFLLWQISYAELYFCDCYWPDFDERQFGLALKQFAFRQRRFGRSSDQVAASRESIKAGGTGENCAAAQNPSRVAGQAPSCAAAQNPSKAIKSTIAGCPPHA